MPSTEPQYLLLQDRLLEDPMRIQEIRYFTHALGCDETRISPLDLLRDRPSIDQLKAFDVVFIGNSGAYSITNEENWVEYVLKTMRDLFDRQIPTFDSC